MKTLLALPLLLLLLSMDGAAQPSIFTLHPPPKSGFPTGAHFELGRTPTIVASSALTVDIERAVAWLETRLKRDLGIDPVRATVAPAGEPAIFVGTLDAEPILSQLPGAMLPGESIEVSGGYLLHISADRIVLGGKDAEGVFSGVATLMQLASGTRITGAHVLDYPDYPDRWVFNMANLRGPGQLVALRTILDTMATLKFNGIQQNDFKYSLLASQPDFYFDSVDAFRQHATDRGVGIIPGVAPIGYSEGLLWHNPNLAEGAEARTRYLIDGDTGRIIPDPRVTIPNGMFESVDGNGKFTGWSFYDESSLAIDRGIFRGGSISARGSNFQGPNCRFSRRLDCRPHSYYRLSAWVRTEDLDADMLQLLALGIDSAGGYRALTFTQFSVPATSDGWRQIQVSFNTLWYSSMQVYVGLWGAHSGIVWFDDFAIEDAGLVNVLRRGGTPLHVRSTRDEREYTEGIDFAPVIDGQLGGGGGSYPWHQGPTFRRLPEGSLRNGDTIEISYFHPITTLHDEHGYGQNMVCLSEDTLYTLLDDQIRRVDTLYAPGRWLMQHDEVRVMNLDSACLQRNMSPAELLADNTRRSFDIIRNVRPNADVYVWSDMFDSLHNATASYYLVNGDLRGIWNIIPRELIIGNWASFAMEASLGKFAAMGFRQIVAPYYDERGTRNMRAWRLAIEGIDGARGMLYTTWVGDYSYLRPFAYYAWGAGPWIVHTPLDTSVLSSADDLIELEAVVKGDPYDPSDSIVGVRGEFIVVDLGGTRTRTVNMLRADGDRWAGVIAMAQLDRRGFAYRLVARNAQGLECMTPLYELAGGVSGVESSGAHVGAFGVEVIPNPVTGSASFRFTLTARAEWQYRVIDGLGRTILEECGIDGPGEHRLPLEASALAPGAYRGALRVGSVLRSVPFTVVR